MKPSLHNILSCRSFLLLLLFLSGVTCAVSAYAEPQGPKVEIDGQVWDFGTIQEKKGPVSHEFIITNSGDEPLMIVSANASCGCTKPEFSAKPIKPGHKDKIKVTFNPAGRPGEFVKNVSVRTNAKGKGHKRFTLRIKGSVIPVEP